MISFSYNLTILLFLLFFSPLFLCFLFNLLSSKNWTARLTGREFQHLRNKFDLQKSEGKIKKGVSVNPEIHEAGCPGVFWGFLAIAEQRIMLSL